MMTVKCALLCTHEFTWCLDDCWLYLVLYLTLQISFNYIFQTNVNFKVVINLLSMLWMVLKCTHTPNLKIWVHIVIDQSPLAWTVVIHHHSRQLWHIIYTIFSPPWVLEFLLVQEHPDAFSAEIFWHAHSNVYTCRLSHIV